MADVVGVSLERLEANKGSSRETRPDSGLAVGGAGAGAGAGRPQA